jgi:hypothetical protein
LLRLGASLDFRHDDFPTGVSHQAIAAPVIRRLDVSTVLISAGLLLAAVAQKANLAQARFVVGRYGDGVAIAVHSHIVCREFDSLVADMDVSLVTATLTPGPGRPPVPHLIAPGLCFDDRQ